MDSCVQGGKNEKKVRRRLDGLWWGRRRVTDNSSGGQNRGRGGAKAKQGDLMSCKQGVNDGKGKGQRGRR